MPAEKTVGSQAPSVSKEKDAQKQDWAVWSTSKKVADIAETMMRAVEAGTAPWQHPWVPGEQVRPCNAASGTLYTGMNAMRLILASEAAGHKDDRWMTFKQATDRGYKIKKGAKAVPIVYYCPAPEEPKNEEDKAVTRKKAVLRYSMVFNAADIEGIPEQTKKYPNLEICNKNAELVLSHSGAKIENKEQSEAYYSPKRDTIYLPLKKQFTSEAAYYQTALHELGHWTGHSSRLNRPITGDMKSAKYAKEELCAEIASCFLAMSTGIGTNMRHREKENSLSYIDSWLTNGTRDQRKKDLMKAISDAGKVHDFLVKGLEKELGIAPEVTPEMSEEQRRNIDAAKSVFEANDYSATGRVIGVNPEENTCIMAVAHKNYCLQYPLDKLDRTPEVGEFSRFHCNTDTHTWSVEHYDRSKEQSEELGRER